MKKSRKREYEPKEELKSKDWFLIAFMVDLLF